jgi:hypothetical protein
MSAVAISPLMANPPMTRQDAPNVEELLLHRSPLLLLKMDKWNVWQIRFNNFSTEGTPYLMWRGLTVAVEGGTFNDTIPDADVIAELFLLIFCIQEATILNATRARLIKHRESYDAKTLNNVLGMAVKRTFGIGLLYNFDHFNCPEDNKEASIHQLRMHMAMSAVRHKRELDGAMASELGVLCRLKDNIIAASNQEVAEDKMKYVERVV